MSRQSVTSRLSPPVSDEHLRLIGLITVNFSWLETVISMGIWKLLGYERQQDIGNIVTSELSFRNLMALLSALSMYKLSNAKTNAELKKLLKKSAQAEEKRNLIMHSLYATREGPEDVIRMKTTAKVYKGLKYHRERLTIDELSEIADFVAAVAFEFLEFVMSLQIPQSGSERD